MHYATSRFFDAPATLVLVACNKPGLADRVTSSRQVQEEILDILGFHLLLIVVFACNEESSCISLEMYRIVASPSHAAPDSGDLSQGTIKPAWQLSEGMAIHAVGRSSGAFQILQRCPRCLGGVIFEVVRLSDSGINVISLV